eukprot:m.268967 g.268967  ORF g.268967 m.268967 type:complete len:108 (+) comp15663_c6_seq1:140-463(+)
MASRLQKFQHQEKLRSQIHDDLQVELERQKELRKNEIVAEWHLKSKDAAIGKREKAARTLAKKTAASIHNDKVLQRRSRLREFLAQEAQAIDAELARLGLVAISIND